MADRTEAEHTAFVRIHVQRPEDWREARELRLRMLAADPLAFGDTHAAALRRDEEYWRRRAGPDPGLSRTTVLTDDHGRWQATMTVRIEDGRAQLFSVWVAPELRGTSGARQLLDASRGWLSGLGHRKLWLTVQEQNARAISFYRRAGFVPTGVTEPYPNAPSTLEREFILVDHRPVLITKRLRLEPLGYHQLPDLIPLDADREVIRYLFAVPKSPDEVIKIWMPRRTNPDYHRRGLGFWSAYRKSDGRFAGIGMLPARGPDSAELGYRIPSKLWRQGYATEIGRVLLGHGFGTVGLSSINAETMAINAGSRAVMAKLGMRHTASFAWKGDDAPVPGAEQGEVEYRIDAAQWRARAS